MIKAPQYSVGIAGVGNAGIAGIGRDIAALSSAHRMPIAKGYFAVVAAAGGFYRAAILLRAVNVIRKLIVGGHMIKLRGGLVVPRAPGAGAIHADGCALVTA